MIFKEEFLDSMPVPRTYACDPHKHWCCNKSGCMFNLDIPETAKVCDSTLHHEFAWDGVSEREDHYGNTSMRAFVDGYIKRGSDDG